MEFRIGENASEIIKADLSKKYVSSGLKIAGKIKNEKLELYLEDDHGKRSSFMTRTFYGRLNNGVLSGNFRISNFALLMLGILLGVAIESIVMAFIKTNFYGMVLPAIIIVLEICYAFVIKNISGEHDAAVLSYLRGISDE